MLSLYKFNKKKKYIYYNLFLYFIFMKYKLLLFSYFTNSKINYIKINFSFISNIFKKTINNRFLFNILNKNFYILYSDNLNFFFIFENFQNFIIMLCIDYYFINVKYFNQINYLFNLLNKNYNFYLIYILRLLFINKYYLFYLNN